MRNNADRLDGWRRSGYTSLNKKKIYFKFSRKEQYEKTTSQKVKRRFAQSIKRK